MPVPVSSKSSEMAMYGRRTTRNSHDGKAHRLLQDSFQTRATCLPACLQAPLNTSPGADSWWRRQLCAMVGDDASPLALTGSLRRQELLGTQSAAVADTIEKPLVLRRVRCLDAFLRLPPAAVACFLHGNYRLLLTAGSKPYPSYKWCLGLAANRPSKPLAQRVRGWPCLVSPIPPSHHPTHQCFSPSRLVWKENPTKESKKLLYSIKHASLQITTDY